MNLKKIIAFVSVFSFIVILPLSSLFLGSRVVLAQAPGCYYQDGSGSCTSTTDQNAGLCYYWDGSTYSAFCPAASGGNTTASSPASSGGNTTASSPASSGSSATTITIPNPLAGSGNSTLYGFISNVINGVVVPIGGVLAVLYIMYAGFLMVTARGNEDQIKKGRAAFTHAVIGTAILLGAWVIATVVQNTINSLTG